MKKLLLIFLLTVSASAFPVDSDFGDFSGSMRESFATFSQEKRQDWDNFAAEMRQKQAAFEAELAKQWGSETEVSDRKTWVEYSRDRRVKRAVDFENDQIRISVLGDVEPSEMQALVEQQLSELLETKADEANQEYPVVQEMAKAADKQIRLPEQTPVLVELKELHDESSSRKLANLLAKSAKLEERAIEPVAPEPKKQSSAKTHSQVKPSLPDTPKVVLPKKPEKKPERPAEKVADKPEKRSTVAIIDLSKKWPVARAKKYRVAVEEFSKKMDVERSLAYAMIYTESSFNPVAVSPIPAYGLMQIVPTSAGRDVTKMHFGREEVLSPDYLFTPNKNIEVGTGYLNILDKRYLRKITNPLSRKYCMIAAYNTGAGNVAKAFTGKLNISRAAKVINELEPQEVYDTLIEKLPYEETRRYLVKVTKAEKQFAGL